MQLILVATLLSLIAGTSCQLFATNQQTQCAIAYGNANLEDAKVRAILTNCPNFDVDVYSVCTNQACRAAADGIYKICGYTNFQQGEFNKAGGLKVLCV